MPGVITLTIKAITFTIKVITPFMPVAYLFHKLKSGYPNLYHISYKICRAVKVSALIYEINVAAINAIKYFNAVNATLLIVKTKCYVAFVKLNLGSQKQHFQLCLPE